MVGSLELLIVIAAVVASAGYVLLTLLPKGLRRAVALRLEGRVPGWLQRRLARGTGCCGDESARVPRP
jgi:hypothetical protein